MGLQFTRHYSLEEARALLPSVRQWLTQLQQLRRRLQHVDKPVSHLIDRGYDAGGKTVHDMVRLVVEMRSVLQEFHSREIQIKDLDRGLVDFPAIIGGREVFLCWEQDEDDIEFWHDLDAGYAGRERL